MANMTHEEQRIAGQSHLKYFRELLDRDGDKAQIQVYAAQMRSLIAAASPDKR